MDGLGDLLLVLAAVGSGMLAGIYAIFSIAIMPALADLAPDAGMRAMQRINIRIQNPPFLLLFMGTPLVAIVAAGLGSSGDDRPGSADLMLVAGAALVTIGSLVITAVANVPRNNALDAIDADGPGAIPFWSRFLGEWTRLNHLRAVLCVLAAGCFALAGTIG